MDVAKLEAAQLAEAIRRKKQPHGGEVVRIVSTRSKSQLAATFQCYKEQHGSDIEEVCLLLARFVQLISPLFQIIGRFGYFNLEYIWTEISEQTH